MRWSSASLRPCSSRPSARMAGRWVGGSRRASTLSLYPSIDVCMRMFPLVRFLKTSWFKFGLTARLHRYAEALIVAVELNRTLITPVPGLEYGLFKPRTSCSESRVTIRMIRLGFFFFFFFSLCFPLPPPCFILACFLACWGTRPPLYQPALFRIRAPPLAALHRRQLAHGSRCVSLVPGRHDPQQAGAVIAGHRVEPAVGGGHRRRHTPPDPGGHYTGD